MGKLEWLKWEVRYGNRKTRFRNIRFFLAFELYNLCCKLHSYRITHWLDGRPSLPEGRYLRVIRPAPLAVRLLDKIFSFGKEAHASYLPYTPEAEEEVRRVSGLVQVGEISYNARVERSG